MRPRGLEPPPSCPDQNLNLARLPIPPRAHMVDVNRIFQIYFRKFGRHLVDIDVFERFFEDFKSSGKARKPLILLGFWGIDRPPDPVTRVLEPESSESANSTTRAKCGQLKTEPSHLSVGEMVRVAGLEPARPYEHKHLKLACLPVPAHSHSPPLEQNA